MSEATKIDPVTGQPIQEGVNPPVISEDGDKPAEQTPAAPAPAGEDVNALKAKIAKLEGEVTTLEGTVETLKAEKTAALEGEAKAKNDLQNVTVLLDQAKKEVKTAQDNLVLKESELGQAITLREAAENQLIEAKASVREGLVEKVMILRKSLNKPVIAKEDLEKRSDDSLNDNIKDLAEEMGGIGVVTQIETPNNPTLIKDEEKDNLDVKEKKNTSNIDLTEGLNDILNSIMGSRSYK